MVTKWQGLAAANDAVLRHLKADGGIRPGMDTVKVCRLIGAVASVADSGHLPEAETRALLAVVADGVLVCCPVSEA